MGGTSTQGVALGYPVPSFQPKSRRVPWADDDVRNLYKLFVTQEVANGFLSEDAKESSMC
jgi:hypothetical protein